MSYWGIRTDVGNARCLIQQHQIGLQFVCLLDSVVYERSSRHLCGDQIMQRKYLVVLLLTFAGSLDSTNVCFSEEITEEKLRQWVTELGDADFNKRSAATKSLIETGRPAIEVVSEAISSEDDEVSQRATNILITFFESADDRTYRDVMKALRELAQSKNSKVVRFATQLIDGPKQALAWIEQMGGEFTVDQRRPDQPVVELRLDRTRGIDPGFTSDEVKDGDLQQLKMLREIRLLTLEYRTTMTDAGLHHLAKLYKLESLNLSRTRITGSGLGDLEGLSNLKTLNLAGCSSLNEDGFRNLGRLKQLRELNLHGTSNSGTSDGDWSTKVRMQQRYGHDSLSQYRGGITDTGLKHIGELVGLTSLSLERTRITTAGLAFLKNLTQLETLDLSRTAINDEALEELSERKELKNLRLNFTPISDAGLGSLKALQGLDELQLQGTPITDAGLRELAGLKQIRSLDLQRTYITDASIDVLKELPQLNSLNVRMTKISFSGLVRLARDCEHFNLKSALLAGGLGITDKDGNLISVNLSYDQVKDDDLKLLQPFHSLQRLSLRDNHVTDRGLAHLRELKQLRFLTLNNTLVTNEGLIHLEDMNSLEDLRIHDTKVTFRGVFKLFTEKQERSLSEALRVVRYFERDDNYPVLYEYDPHRNPNNLSLPETRLPPIQQLRTGRSPRDLKFLDVSNANLTDADVASLAELESLGALFLNDNPISDQGISHLTRHEHLEVLWASGQEISGQSLAHLSKLQHLHTLWLTETGLSDRDLVHLPAFPKLRILNLSGANITDAAVSHLQKCKSLGVLFLDDYILTDSALMSLRKALPEIYIQQSQANILADVRGLARRETQFSAGPLRGQVILREEMGPVKTVVPERFPLLRIFGDAHFERAERMSFANQEIARVESWSKLTTLTDVGMINTDISDEAVAGLKHLKQLKRVSFSGSRLNDEALASLSGCGIERLDLQRTTVTDACLVHVKELKQLKSLSLGGYGTQINDPGIAQLSTLTGLEVLGLNRTNITDDAFAHLKPLRNLKVLNLREVDVDHGLKHLAGLTNLESLDLFHTFVSDDSLPSLYGLKQLKQLSLEGTLVTADGIQQLQQRLPTTRIEVGTLIAQEDRPGAEPLKRMRAFLRLDTNGRVTSVNLYIVPETHLAMQYVLKLGELKVLRMGSQANDMHLEVINQLTQLTELDLTDSKVTDDGLAHLSGMDHLQRLVLNGSGISDNGLTHLKQMTMLRELYLRRTSVSAPGVEVLKKMLPHCKIFLSDSSDTR